MTESSLNVQSVESTLNQPFRGSRISYHNIANPSEFIVPNLLCPLGVPFFTPIAKRRPRRKYLYINYIFHTVQNIFGNFEMTFQKHIGF